MFGLFFGSEKEASLGVAGHVQLAVTSTRVFGFLGFVLGTSLFGFLGLVLTSVSNEHPCVWVSRFALGTGVSNEHSCAWAFGG